MLFSQDMSLMVELGDGIDGKLELWNKLRNHLVSI